MSPSQAALVAGGGPLLQTPYLLTAAFVVPGAYAGLCYYTSIIYLRGLFNSQALDRAGEGE